MAAPLLPDPLRSPQRFAALPDPLRSPQRAAAAGIRPPLAPAPANTGLLTPPAAPMQGAYNRAAITPVAGRKITDPRYAATTPAMPDPNKAAAGVGALPVMQMPTGRGAQYWDANAQGLMDAYNQNPTLGGFFNAREQLAQIMSRNSQQRYYGGGLRGSGPGYGSSGPGGVGFGGGRTV